MTMMYQDRAKGLLWFWLFKSAQMCFALRRPLHESGGGSRTDGGGSDGSYGHHPDGILASSWFSSSYTRLGRIPISGLKDGLDTGRDVLGWSTWNNKNLHVNCREDSTRNVRSSASTSSNFLLAGRRLCRSSSSSQEKLEHENPLSPSLRRGDGNTKLDYGVNDNNPTEDEEDSVYLDGVAAVTDEELFTVSLTSTRTKRKMTRAPPSSPPSEQDDVQSLSWAMTRPIVPSTISLDGNEEWFDNPDTIALLADSGLEMAIQDDNDWIDWQMHDATRKLLAVSDEETLLQQGKILVYIGTAKQNGHGSHLPILKTKSILPLSANDMADLLMDSSKVKIYNKMSLGRTDVRILDFVKADKDVDGTTTTKVVCSLTQPPIAKSQMVSCTLMHSRKVVTPIRGYHDDSRGGNHESFLVVSRAVPGLVDEELLDLPRNDILLGVNLLEDRGPNECMMTAITHLYSPALPTMLAKGMGVSSAINFVRDIRKACADNSASAL